MKYSSAIVAATVIAFTLLLAGNISAATFIVTNTNDSGPGSLRQAFLDSYTNNTEDIINFDAGVFGATPQTITLTSGELTVPPDYSNGPFTGVTINGPGAKLLTISGNNNSRIIAIQQNGKLAIHGVTLTGGNGTGSGIGYALNGGAIMVEPGGPGVGAHSLVVTNSIITGNSAKHGGGIFDTGISSLVMNTAIINNSAQEQGGGISSHRMNCINCTISGNTAADGGGIYVNYGGAMNVTNSTVAFNTAASAGGISGYDYYLYPGNIYLKNSIVAKNTTTGQYVSDIDRVSYHSTGPNIIARSYCCYPSPGPQDMVNVDPKLNPQLQENGSVIPTYALMADSPAIDRGDNCVLSGCVAAAVTTDQRGVPRPQDGDGNGSAIVDIGAFEVSAAELAMVPAQPDLLTADDTGFSSTDNITRAQNLHFQLNNLIGGATVNVYRNGSLLQSFVAAGSSASISDLNLPPDVKYSYTARQTAGGMESIYSASADITIDNTRPYSTLYQPANQVDPASFQPIKFVIGFSEPVAGLSGSHISLSGSTANVSSATVSLSPGTVFPSYNISISGIASDGLVVATLPENTIADPAGNPNWVSSHMDNAVAYDTGRPRVTINQAAGQADPALSAPINFTVVFSEHVSGFDRNDISLAGSTANVSSANIVVTGSGATYNVAVNNIASSGVVWASVMADGAYDIVNRYNFPSTSTDNLVTLNLRHVPFDYDGDGRSDISVFRPSEGNWYLSQSQSGLSVQNFGLGSDVITPGDFDADGKTDLAIFRPSNGTWWYKSTLNGGSYAVQFGLNGDIPLAEDYNGDGQADFVIFRPSTSTWYRLSSTGEYRPFVFGTAGDIPLVADMDGDGKADPTIYRPSTGTWWYAGSTDGLFYAIQWGEAGVIPVPGDYDGDRKTDPAYFRPSDGAWFIVYSGAGYSTYTAFLWGATGDVPVAADYDGDGKTDPAIYRPSNSMWFIVQSTGGPTGMNFGLSGDKPVPSAFIY